MSFRITGLDPSPFAPLFALSDAELAARGMRRRFADEPVGFPCRVSLDAAPARSSCAARPAPRGMLADSAVAYVHAHYAKTGCFAARIDRA